MMDGFLLLSPTGSGKSWACSHDPFYIESAIDGDSLINWKFDWDKADWLDQDRQHLNIVLCRMLTSRKCVCWFVGTTAVEDALGDGRLRQDQVAVVLSPKAEHRAIVEGRGRRTHGWRMAVDHRALCEAWVRNYGLPCFRTFAEAAGHVRAWLACQGVKHAEPLS